MKKDLRSEGAPAADDREAVSLTACVAYVLGVDLSEAPGGGEVGLRQWLARRNLGVRGVALDGLIGKRFRVGEVECFGQRRCEPCAHLERLTRPGVLRGLVHRGGLRADVISSGKICTGDLVEEF